MKTGTPTEAQKAARDRNWKIFKLRGLYAQVWMLTGERRDAARAAVDQELFLMGAESETERMLRHRRELENRLMAQ